MLEHPVAILVMVEVVEVPQRRIDRPMVETGIGTHGVVVLPLEEPMKKKTRRVDG